MPSSGASAAITPSYGFNLFDLRLPAARRGPSGDRRRRRLRRQPRAAGPERHPDLVPVPEPDSRRAVLVRGARLQLFIEPGKEHAIHGFAIAAPWEVVESGATEDHGAFLVGRFQIATQRPRAARSWPADAILTVRYALAGRRLDMTITVENPTDRNLPFGFGIHPYFRLPFAPGTPRAGRLVLPAAEMWVLDQKLPTGERVPVEPRVDFRGGGSTAGRHLDDVLTDLTFDEGRCTCRLVDDDLNCETVLSFDPTSATWSCSSRRRTIPWWPSSLTPRPPTPSTSKLAGWTPASGSSDLANRPRCGSRWRPSVDRRATGDPGLGFAAGSGREARHGCPPGLSL